MAGLFDGLDWGQLATGFATPGMNPQDPNFNDRFGAAFPRSPISPENLAGNLAARGVPPPQGDITPLYIPPPQTNVGAALTGQDVINPGQPYRMADQQSVDDWRNSVDVNNAGVGGTPAPKGVGGASPGAPMNIQSPVQEQQVAQAASPTDVSAKKKEGGDTLLDALKGIKAPAAPELQRLSTPAAPRPTSNVKGGNLLAMLQALNVGQGAGDRSLPSTLAAALRKG